MTTADDTIQRLTRQPRGTGRLDTPAVREALPEAISEAVPPGTDTSPGGLVSPLVEQAYAGSTYYSLVSSDGLFVYEYGDQTEYVDDDGTGVSMVVKHLDMTP
jgi:hypothetical protein